MNNYISTILKTAQAIGSINNGSITEANKYEPKTVRFGGVAISGDVFELELRIGDKKNEDT